MTSRISSSDIKDKTRLVNRHIGFFLAIFVALVPIPLASNRPAFWLIEAALLALAVLYYIFALRFDSTRWRVQVRHFALPGLVFALFSITAALQIIVPISSDFAPVGWAIASEQFASSRHSVTPHLTANPAASTLELLRTISLFLVFFLTLQISRNMDRGNWLISVIFWTIVTIAIYGLLVQFSGSQTVLFFKKQSYENAVTGTFINRNAFAAYCGIGLCCGLSVMIRAYQTTLARQMRHGGKHAAGRAARGFLDLMASRTAIIALGFGVILCALVMTGSRMGIVSSFAGLLAIFRLSVASGRIPGRILFGALVVTALLSISVFGIAGELLFERIEDSGNSRGSRAGLYRDGLSALLASPLTGYGAGAFADIYPSVQTEGAAFFRTWSYAHNSYLETALEYGFPVTLFALIVMIAIALKVIRQAAMRAGRGVASLATSGSLVLVAIHSTIDFPVQMQAVSVTLIMMAAIALGQAMIPIGNATGGSSDTNRPVEPEERSETGFDDQASLSEHLVDGRAS